MTEAPGKQHFAMADVSAKQRTQRRALAAGSIALGEAAFNTLKDGKVPKGDPIAMAEIAGIQGAKLTPQLLPLCHPIALSRIAIHTKLDADSQSVQVFAIAEINERTGVEMEALTGLNIALLTLWDLCKPLNAALRISDVTLRYKSGGKQGEWIHPEGLTGLERKLLGLTAES
jgi:molybdenum cofactor biosynthesis protein MoaC